MRWNWQCLAIRSNKHYMTCATLTPLNPVSFSNGFDLLNPPITRIDSHFVKDFFRVAHTRMILLVIS